MSDKFLSQENLDKITRYLAKIIPLKNTAQSRQTFKKFVYTQMKDTFSKFGSRKPQNVSSSVFINKLNEKTIQTCIDIYEEKTGKKLRSDNINLTVKRDREINGERKNSLMKRPLHPMKHKNDGLPGLTSSVGGDYAPIATGQGEYITATGEMGSKMFFGNMGQQMGLTNNKSSSDELQRMMLEKASDYDPRPRSMGNMGGGMGGMGNMGGMDSMAMDMELMNPQMGYGRTTPMQRRPESINFALDGGDTRNSGQDVENFGGDIGMMDSSMMGMGGMGNMMYNMGGMGMSNMMGNMPNNMMSMPNNMNMMSMPNNMNMPNNMMSMPNNMMGMNGMMGGMSGMMGGGMQNMNMSGMNGMMDNKMNQDDLKMRMNQIMSDRGQLDSKMSMHQNGVGFNPSISPNMRSDFQVGGRAGFLDIKNMDSKDMQAQIDKTKRDIANLFGLDTKKIKDLSPKKIDEVINSIRKGEESQYLLERTEKHGDDKIMDLIKKLREKNSKKQQNLDDSINHEIKKTITKKTSKPKNVIINDDTDSIMDKKAEEKKKYEIDIDPSDYVDPEYYNDYMIALPNSCYNITAIELNDINFSPALCDIKQGKNEFKYSIGDDVQCFELNAGQYKIGEVIEAIQSGFDEIKAPLKISINNDIIQISHKNRKHFKLINDANSLLANLGFSLSVYAGKSVYKSGKIAQVIHIYIDTISHTEPIASINLYDCPKQIKMELKNPVAELNELFVKLKNTITTADDLYDCQDKYTMKLVLHAD